MLEALRLEEDRMRQMAAQEVERWVSRMPCHLCLLWHVSAAWLLAGIVLLCSAAWLLPMGVGAATKAWSVSVSTAVGFTERAAFRNELLLLLLLLLLLPG
jgi:hypothetical protein